MLQYYSTKLIMDAEKGLCWRCELRKACMNCSRCKIAGYCGTLCLNRDKLRHKVECDMWNRNNVCSRCKKRTECSVCAACREVTYCSRDCQLKHWSDHKAKCKKIRKDVKVMAERYTFEIKTLKDIQTIEDVPYYFGNTMAVDVLKLGLNEAGPTEDIGAGLSKDYNILLAGVGDLRNLLLTTASLPSMFSGNINFTLNDIDPFILARNAMFLYMIITRKSRPVTITNIWYSLQLPDEDFKFLMSILDELIQHTAETLKSKTNKQIQIEEHDFEMLKDVWKKWREMECETFKPNSINLFAQRSIMFASVNYMHSMSYYIARISQTPYRSSASNYFINGLFLPQSTRERSNLRYDNPTLTGRPKLALPFEMIPKFCNFVYCIRPDLWPFYSWDAIQAERATQTDSIVDMFHTYITNIVRSAGKHFKKGIVYITFSLKACTEICKQHDVQRKFDRIMTSNIVDYTGIRNLLRSMRPLMSTSNRHAVLVTETLNWRRCCPEADLDREVNEIKAGQLKELLYKDIGYRYRNDMSCLALTDYFDNTELFLRYLRSTFLATNDDSNMEENVPCLPNVFDNIEGFKLRNFTKQLNKIVPFRYRLNARMCTTQSGVHRNLEWTLDGHVPQKAVNTNVKTALSSGKFGTLP